MGNGVIRREKSIQLFFVVDGKHVKKTLRAGGKPLPPTPANLKFAERTAIEIRQRLAAGAFVMTDYFPDEQGSTVGVGTTVAGQLKAWLTAQRVEASTRKSYESAARFFEHAPADAGGKILGDIPIRSVVRSHILTALASRPKLSGKTVNNYVSVLREALEMAVLDGKLKTNPAAAIPRASHQKAPPDPFSAEEAELVIAEMGARYDPQVRNFTAFKFFTGLRSSEAFALQWRNVDLVRGEVLVSEAIVRGVHKATTKTNTARVVRLNSRAMAAIQDQRKHTQLAGGFVFHDPRYGEAWADERAYRRSHWEPCIKRLGIRYRPPYNTRHTYATMMLMAGMRPSFCAKQMGHSVEIFLSTYTRWLDGASDDLEMAKLETSLALPSKPSSESSHL